MNCKLQINTEIYLFLGNAANVKNEVENKDTPSVTSDEKDFKDSPPVTDENDSEDSSAESDENDSEDEEEESDSEGKQIRLLIWYFSFAVVFEICVF